MHSKKGDAIMKEVSTTKAPAAIGPYVQANIIGQLVFVSGQLGLDPSTGEMVGSTVTEQTNQIMKNIEAILAEAGTDLDHVVKTTCFLRDMGDFDAFNQEYAKAFVNAKPARSAVAVACLPKNALVEVETIAELR